MELTEMAVGIANLPNQIHRRNVINGFDFNLLVAGDSGLGKSTFLNMLFHSDLYTEVSYDNFPSECPSTPQFKTSSITLNENYVKLRMELIELCDIGWSNDTQPKWDEITKLMTNRLEQYLTYEDLCDDVLTNFRDPRIHCCLYFIPPLSHRLRSVDINFLKTVCKWVNVIPLISKADTLTPDELIAFKARIREDLNNNHIQIYTFPDLNDLDSCQPNISHLDTLEKPNHYDIMPFAIVGSNCCVEEEDGSKSYVRKYPWGTIKIDDPKHSDFEIFKNFFLKTHMFHMIFFTKKCIYEKYRREKLCTKLNIGNDMVDDNDDDNDLSCSDASVLANEVIKHGLSLQKESEHIQQLESKLAAEYDQKVEEYNKIVDATYAEYKSKYDALEKELVDEASSNLLSRSHSKSSKNEKTRKALLKYKNKLKN